MYVKVDYPKKLQLEFVCFQGLKYLAHALSNYPSTVDKAAIKKTGGTHFIG